VANFRTHVVETDSGPVCGVDDGDVIAFLGIPYAAPPVGDLRWMPPQPPAPWTDTRDCHEYGNDSLQLSDLGVFGRAGGDEDCLYLNIFAPKRPLVSHAKLPVMFWIHGGGTVAGSGRDYDPRKLVIQGQAIVVTFNYRLGVLGYFAHPDIDAEGHPSGNYGIMDQQFALDWVQRNIAAFDGDPGNVTVFGESAGGNSGLAHLVSPYSRGKFQHVILMSGGSPILKWPAFGSPVPMEHKRAVGLEFAKAVHCDDAASLRRVPAGELLAAQGPYVSTLQFTLDGDIVPTHPAQALQSGDFNRATVVVGQTLDEGTFFAGLMENGSGSAMTDTDYRNEITNLFGDLAEQILAEYPSKDFLSPAEAYSAVFTDHMFSSTGVMIATWTSRWTPTYMYEFTDKTAPSYLEPTSFPMGASHTYELPFLFDGFHGAEGRPVKLNAWQEKLSTKMVEYWTSLAEAGTREGEWPRYDPEADNVLMLGLPEPRMVNRHFAEFHRLSFWQKTGIYGP
jgi:para-nitrobenzyl esterase